MKQKSIFVCQECGAKAYKWQGRCTVCGAWNSFVEELPEPVVPAKHKGIMVSSENNAPLPMNKVDLSSVERFLCAFGRRARHRQKHNIAAAGVEG